MITITTNEDNDTDVRPSRSDSLIPSNLMLERHSDVATKQYSDTVITLHERSTNTSVTNTEDKRLRWGAVMDEADEILLNGFEATTLRCRSGEDRPLI